MMPGLEETGRRRLCALVAGAVGRITWANLLPVCAAPGTGLSWKCEREKLVPLSQ